MQKIVKSKRYIRFLILILGLLVSVSGAAQQPNFTLTGVKDSDLTSNISLHLQTVEVDTTLSPERLWKQPIQEAVKNALRPYGFYNTEMVIIDDQSTITINIELGQPLLIENINLEVIGAGRQDEWFAKRFKQFPLQVGQPLRQHEYDKFKTDMVATAISRGYFDFTWQAARLDLVRETNEANVLLIAQSGPRYRFGRLVIKGDDMAADIINRINTLTYGDFYQADALGQFNRELNKTGYFSRVIARPVVSQADNFHVPIEVTVAQKPRDLFDVGGGYSSDIGPRLDVKWRRPWVNSDGHSLTTEMFVSQPEQSLSSSYKVPMADVNDDYLVYQVGYERTDDDDTKSQRFSLSAQRFWRPSDSDWQHGVSIRYQNETFIQGALPQQTTQLILPGYSISGMRSRGGLDIEWGNRNIFTIEAGSKSLASDIDIVRVVGKTKWIRSLNKHRLTARAEIGAIETSDFSRVPASLRFFTGGDQSIRGFGYNDISPRDDSGVETGAKYLVVGSLEYAYSLTPKWRIATFIDAGTATNNFDEDISVGTGIGVHYVSVIGPIRVYFAHGRNEYYGSNNELHISIGPTL